ncbi:MAG: hypothetical protein ISR98_00730 [Parcubacteria group bacterium]|nr:hypothetical protein [Parcubacteria group bacterium]
MDLLQVTENNNMEKESFFSMKVIIVFVVGIIIGFLGAWIPMRDTAEIVEEVNVEVEEEAADVTLSGENAILVRDQKAGLTIDVELVTLENTGWVVIHEDNNGVLGNALGAQLFLAGVNSGTVDLLRGMEAGKTYHAAIRQDDGDNAFDLTKDFLLSDGKGDPVQVSFIATAE